MLEEEVAVQALAEQPPLHVGEGDDDGVERVVGAELVEGQHREKAEGEPASRLPPAAQCRSGPSSTSDGTSSICASSPPAMCAGAPWLSANSSSGESTSRCRPATAK